ncbi:hypothetical protein GA0070612_0943 [Micromonospora chokoriensis]|uniref:Uncharacterized protein n=1 Tax=Micromonospora chokoriensis TaxID=356851 RepID=A0A1C4V0G0_9ACTN|nr:hypothetical protein GA0070612_0943 [Micromonospora chokoriensis]
MTTGEALRTLRAECPIPSRCTIDWTLESARYPTGEDEPVASRSGP